MGDASSATGPATRFASRPESSMRSSSRRPSRRHGRSSIGSRRPPIASSRGRCGCGAGPRSPTFRIPRRAVREHAAHLELLRVEALRTWFDVRLGLGRHRELVPELAALAEQQPYDEALVAQLMLALYRSHRQAEALETARSLEARLRDDLGIDPSPEIRNLYRDILLQAPDLDLEPPEPPGNLPSRLTSFIGRTRELREVAALLEDCRLVTLTGPGGIGKTRLALEVARQQRSRFPGGTWWVDLAPVTEPETVLDELAGILGLAPRPGPELREAVARALDRRRVLLLIDNCEHLAAAVADVVGGLLEATSGPGVLATSRTPLRVEGERLWPVPPLSLPAEGSAANELADSDAVQLFVERGRAVMPTFALDGNGAVIGEVCRRLDGLSLAIEMAAARLPVLSPKEIARHLDDRFALLELSAVGRPTRHRTMEAAIDASHALLSERDKAMFERLAVFVGPFDIDAAGAVGLGREAAPSEVLASVAALVEASMLTIERAGDQTRYRLLETLGEYGLARLRRRGVEDDVRQAHAEYYLDEAAQAGEVLGTPDVARVDDPSRPGLRRGPPGDRVVARAPDEGGHAALGPGSSGVLVPPGGRARGAAVDGPDARG